MRRDGPIVVLAVEASPLFSTLLRGALVRREDISFTPAAGAGEEMRERILEHHPDVIIMDLALPDAEIRALLRDLREYYPAPVIACSGASKRDAKYALELIECGVLDVVVKPGGFGAAPVQQLGADLAAKIHAAADEARPAPPPNVRTEPVESSSLSFAGLSTRRRLIVIGASTGGTEALRVLLSHMPADSPPIVVVQHMPPVFTASFADRLNVYTPLRVSEACEGDVLTPGCAVIARGDTHLTVRRCAGRWLACYTHQKPVNRHCPSVDVLFDSAVIAAGANAIGIILTGMGADGARGMLRLHHAGALTIAQNAASCVVFGMPKAAIELGAAELIGRPENIPRLIVQALAAQESALAPHASNAD